MPVDYNVLLRSLNRKKLEYETAIEAINQTFEELGLGISTIVGPGQSGVEENPEVQRSGIRIKGELSFRGKDKAEEYFRLLDRDNDNFLSYEDLRMMEAFNHPYSLVKNGSFQSSAAWSIMMQNENVPVQQGMFVNTRSFLKYRHLIDNRQPLSRELQVTGLGLLPQYLKHWAHLKKLLRSTLASRDVRVTLATADRSALEGQLTVSELQEVLAAGNTPLTTPELFWYLRLLRIHHIAQKELLRTYAKRRLAQADFPFETTTVQIQSVGSRSPSRASSSRRSKRRSRLSVDEEEEERFAERLVTVMRPQDSAIEPEHLQQAPLNQILAWILRYFPPKRSGGQSANLSPLQSTERLGDCAFDFNSFGRRCLSMRAHLVLFVRHLDRIGRFLFDFAGHLNDRLVFRDLTGLLYDKQAHNRQSKQRASRHARSITGLSSLPNSVTETAVYKFSISIGDAAVSGSNSSSDGHASLSGLSLHWKLARVDSVESAAKRLGGVPAGAGFVISLDLLCRDPTSIAPPCISLIHSGTAAAVEEQWTAGANLLRSWILVQLTDVVCKEHNVNFLGANVLYTTSELDDAPVYRILVYYKRLVCTDRWLETLLIPFPLIDLIPACAGDIKTSLDLHRLGHSQHSNPADTDGCNVSFDDGDTDGLTGRSMRSNQGNNVPATGRSTVSAAGSTAHSSAGSVSGARHHRQGSTSMSMRSHEQLTHEALADGPSLNDLFHCQLSGTVGLRSRLLSSLLQRLVCSLSSGLSETQTSYLKTQTSHNSNSAAPAHADLSHSSNATAVSIANTTSNVISNAASMSPVTARSASTAADSHFDDSTIKTTKSTTKDDEEMRFRRWRAVYPFYSWLHIQAQHWAHVLRRWQSGSFRWHYRSVFDLLTKLSLTSYLDVNAGHSKTQPATPSGIPSGGETGTGGFGFRIWKWISDELLLSPGAVPRLLHRHRTQWSEDLQRIHDECAQQLTNQREEEQRARRELLIHGKTSSSALAGVDAEDKVGEEDDNGNMIGSKNHVTRLLKETQHLRSVDAMLTQVKQTEFERTVQSLRVVELLQRYCIGIHSCELLCGKSRLTISSAGLDVFEALLPETPSMLMTFATHEKELLRMRSQHKQRR